MVWTANTLQVISQKPWPRAEDDSWSIIEPLLIVSLDSTYGKSGNGPTRKKKRRRLTDRRSNVQGWFDDLTAAESASLFAAPISHTTRKPVSGRRNASVPQ